MPSETTLPRVRCEHRLAIRGIHGPSSPPAWSRVRAYQETQRGPATRDIGGGQGGEVGASPQRAATAEPTQATGKRPAARRVLAETARWLRCSSVTDPCGYAPSSRVHPAEAGMQRRIAIGPFPRKQDPAAFPDRLLYFDRVRRSLPKRRLRVRTCSTSLRNALQWRMSHVSRWAETVVPVGISCGQTFSRPRKPRLA